MNKVSVIIPTFNRERTLKRAINSIIEQDDPNVEILVCDNGSTDSTLSLLKNMNHKNVYLIDGSSLPKDPGAMRNLGLEKHSGDIVCFLDSDDFYIGPYLPWIRSLLKDHDFVCEGYGGWQKKEFRFLTYEKLAFNNSIVTSSVAMRSSLISSVGLFPIKPRFEIYEDYAYWLRISKLTKIYQSKSRYVHRDSNISDSISTLVISDLRNLLAVFKDFENWCTAKEKSLSSYYIFCKNAQLLKSYLLHFKN